MPYSVVIPAFNAGKTLGETLQSVLAQTVQPGEIIVVDDGSTDRTAEIAQSTDGPVRLLRRSHAGAGTATTVGIAAAQMSIVATVDADDLWLPCKMKVQLEHLDAHPQTDGLFAHWQAFATGGGTMQAAVPGWSRSTMAIRKDAALRVGAMIDPTGGRGEMVDWIARCREFGLVLTMLEQVLALRRIHPGSAAYGRSRDRDRGYAEVAWLALQRRKRGPHSG